MDHREKLAELLIEKGKELLQKPKEINYVSDEKANGLIKDIRNYPHAFVLACVMDRQIPTERAWIIPYRVSEEIGGFDFQRLLKLNIKEVDSLFKKKKLHRFNKIMAKNFYLAIQKIHLQYNNNASNIWNNKPKSATVVSRFLEFKGVGIKIATMAANLLARDYKIPMKDYICIDISPDTHIKRVFGRVGFISNEAGIDEIIYKAREIYPEYPGILDNSCFEIGRNWCKPKNPRCNECYLNKYCPKIT